jgi:hypothetical protein
MLQALPDMEIGRAARNPAAHRYQTARSFTSTLRTAGSPERTRWYALYYDCPAVLTHVSTVQTMPNRCWNC